MKFNNQYVLIRSLRELPINSRFVFNKLYSKIADIGIRGPRVLSRFSMLVQPPFDER